MGRVLLAIGGILVGACCVFAEESADYRLPPEIQPLGQRIELRIDPARAAYSGRVSIDLRVDETTPRIGIYQIDLQMTDIELTSVGSTRQLEAAYGEYDISWLSDGDAIAPGDYELSIAFTGQFSTDALGMHRVTFEDKDYVFTQFEAMYGRRAIPLFDEPSFKIPYTLTIIAPKGHTVIANTPVATKRSADGWQRVEFMVTKPLPSYLIAYAVGPLDRAPLEDMSVPGFVYTPQGHADKVGFVQRETPKIVAALEDYFDMAYPYRKLDFVAVPEFAFGAMENPGLITYRTDLLMVGDELQGGDAERVLNVIAHEVGHIWFGDLVTMGWWNDLWLNEAFATWISSLVRERVYPRFESHLRLNQIGAFNQDQHATSRPIRREVRTEKEGFSDIGLNYTKGSVLLRMLENYVGPETWQEGMRAYMKKHAWGNAIDKDLWAAMSDAAGLDVGSIASTFLNQPGFAILDIGRDGSIKQQRYLTGGQTDDSLEWRVPLNVKYKKDGTIRESFYLLQEKTGQLDIADEAEWIFPDAGANGYFRWKVDLQQFHRLVEDAQHLTDREQIALLDNSEALLNRRDLTLADYLLVIDKLLVESHPLVFRQALNKLAEIGNDFVGPDDRETFGRFVDDAIGPRVAEFGLDERPGDSEAVVKTRPTLLFLLGRYGSDSSAREAAVRIADRYLEAPDSVNGSLGRAALRVTAFADDGGRYDQYIKTYLASDFPDQKSNILASIYFRNPEVIRQHLDFSISSAVTARDATFGIGLYVNVIEDHEEIYRWLGENLDTFEAKVPEIIRPRLPQVMQGVCNAKNLGLLKSFFGSRGDGYLTSLEQVVERLESCIALKQRESAALAEFLSGFTR